MTQLSDNEYLFTSESVTEGHPDKVADQISDAVLDALLAQDKRSRVACETLVKTGVAIVAGEVTTEAWVDLEELVRGVLENEPEDTVVEFICFDLNGLTGHIDHIVASRAACLVFYRLKPYEKRLERIRLFCLPRETHPDHDISWVYMEPGRGKSEIGVTVDARELRDEIIGIIRTHHTQRSDGETHIERSGDTLGLEHFVVKD